MSVNTQDQPYEFKHRKGNWANSFLLVGGISASTVGLILTLLGNILHLQYLGYAYTLQNNEEYKHATSANLSAQVWQFIGSMGFWIFFFGAISLISIVIIRAAKSSR